MDQLYMLLLCHAVGDYGLQSDFIAKTKGDNWWHLFMHCILYVFPFHIAFGFDWRLMITIVIHFVTDAAKARYKKIGYVTDQTIHIANLLLWLWC